MHIGSIRLLVCKSCAVAANLATLMVIGPALPAESVPLYGASCDSYRVTIKFDANGGTGTIADKTVSATTCKTAYYTLPSCSFKRSGYYFDGWLVANACQLFDSEKVLAAGSKIDLNDYADPSDCTTVSVQAVWRKTVTPQEDWLFVYDDGSRETEVGESVYLDLADLFSVSSGSAVTISAAGFPTGIKYDKSSRRLTGSTSKKGVYYVTCSAKNTNGYQMSATIRWTVGEATDGDYDDIGLWDWCDESELENLCVGRHFSTCGYYDVTSVSGLPIGLAWTKGSICTLEGSCTACSDFIIGTPTKAGKYKIVFTGSSGRKTQKTVIVRDGGSAWQEVAVGTRYAGRGTVSGGGVKQSGATVKLSAKPAKNCYFAGWYADAGCTEEFQGGKSGDCRTANESFVFDATEPPSLYAKFVTKDEDADIEIGFNSDDWQVNTENGSDVFEFVVDSQTMPKVTAKGLPNGVKLSGNALVVADTSKLKPGTSVATLTAKNLSGAAVSRDVRIVVPNLQSWVFDGLEYDGVAFTYTVGESDVCRPFAAFDVAEGWTVTASGLPAGLKFNFDRASGTAYLSGMATKAGIYTVTLTAKSGRETEKATFTVEVKPFPADAVGTYGGDIGYDLDDGESDDGVGYDVYSVVGTFSMTIAQDGKVSVKFPANGKTVSLSGYSCSVSDEEIGVSLFDDKENSCDLIVYPQRTLGENQVEGVFGNSMPTLSALGQRNVAKTDAQMKMMVSKLTKLGKIQGVAQYGYIACPGCVLSEVGGVVKPNITFAVGADGQVKASGKIDGRSVSGSALLQVCATEDDWLLYADFCDYKSNTGLLVYRAVFSWNWLCEYYPTASSALCDGAYYIDGGATACKPVIYLYPEIETVCNVKVSLDGRLTCTYPEHGKAGWQEFVASPDGTLTFADQSQYYCLFWEGKMPTDWDFSRGYCVKGSETATFLADILLKMGLSFREANEFIIYWLPQMQDNAYNVIAFQGEKYTNAAKLEISPSPESLLRVFMSWYPSARPVEISAPDIEPFERRGFTVVEWGGTKVTAVSDRLPQ